MCKAIDVANFFLRSPEYDDAGNAISNMKLQKLLYFAQGHALAVLDKPLFKDDFEAWSHGPVIPELYHLYKQYGGNQIPPPDSVDLSRFSMDEKKLLEDVWNTYGVYSAWGLRNLSHSTKPWLDHSESQDIIPKQEIKNYFLTLNK